MSAGRRSNVPQAAPAHAHCRLDCHAAGTCVHQCPTGSQPELCIVDADSQACPSWALQKLAADRVCPAAWPEFASLHGQCLRQAANQM